MNLANRKIAFVGHALVFLTTCTFLLFVAGFTVAMIVGLAWTIGLVSHGYFAVAAPMWRMRLDEESTSARAPRNSARSLEELSASIAHEIRNPVTAARSLVAQIGEDPASPDNAEYARVAIEELDRVERSISHLLRYARDEEITMTDLTLAEVMSSALASVSPRDAEITTSIDAPGPVRGDAEKLRRVVINLVENALDAMEEAKTRGPRVDVAVGENLARTEAWLRVKDNGPGIPQEKLGKIFSPFYTSKKNGTGLGLAISRKVVEAHGGTLEVRSTAGGTELTMILEKRGRA
jgi:signal transduction histidine kinase